MKLTQYVLESIFILAKIKIDIKILFYKWNTDIKGYDKSIIFWIYANKN